MGRKLLLLIALLATLVVLGCWDNRRQMQRVLDEGYATTAQITGAQYQRNLPLAADGWRPRFVEQELSVDLTWQGKDSKTHAFRKVPISESLARTIVNGDQVRLLPLPVKVLDDDTSVPVITSDASARLASLQSWLAAAGYAALAAWAGFAVVTLIGRPKRLSAEPPAALPPRRTFVGLGLLVVGPLGRFRHRGRAGSHRGHRRRLSGEGGLRSPAGLEGRAGGRAPLRPDPHQRGLLEQDNPQRRTDRAPDDRALSA